MARLNSAIANSATEAAASVSAYKLVLLHAPAGYGKTTLLADFARQATLPCCWYILDRSDSDTITFLECLIASIRQRFPHFGVSLNNLLAGFLAKDAGNSKEYLFKTIIEAFIEALETEIHERFALILCNYHEVNENAEITAFLNQLLRRSTSCVLVIESWMIPALEFSGLLARREMFIFGSDFFRLHAREILELATIQGVNSLSDAEAEQLVSAFDGWMVGILLGTRLGDVRFLPTRSDHTLSPQQPQAAGTIIDRQFLFAYVVNEVFSHHPAAYAFLKDACILHEMTPPLCDALLAITNSAQQLRYLEQHGLFVMQSSHAPVVTYTCHSVLRELLSAELHRQNPERFIALHQHAAELLRATKDYERAMYHAIQAETYTFAAHLILDASEQLLIQGHIETLARWIDSLPESIRNNTPKLLLLRASIHCTVGEYSLALPLLDFAQQAILSSSAGANFADVPTLQAEISLARSNVLFHRGAYHEAQHLCQQLLASLPVDEVALRATAHMRLGTCVYLLGDYKAGLTQLQQALQLRGRHTIGHQVADVQSALTNIYSDVGNFALAEHHLARAITCREQLHDEWGRVYDFIRLGTLKRYQGIFFEAEAAFAQALALAQTLHFPRGQAYALVTLGELYQEQGRYDRSLAVTEEGLAPARQVEDIYWINYTLCVLAMTYLYMGDTDTAMLLVSETELPPSTEAMIGYEQAVYSLTYGTILYYQHRYTEASATLQKLASAPQIRSFRREQILTQLRIAACQLAQGQTHEAVHSLTAFTIALTAYGSYEQLVLIELHHLPELEQIVKTLPELAQLRSLLRLEMEQQETPALAQPVPVLSHAEVLSSRPQLRILAFGEPIVLLNAQPMVRWRMARAMELFYLLLDSERPLRKEQIITALWPDSDDEQIDHTFHSTIYYLRKAFGDSCITTQKGSYTLTLALIFGEQVEYDVAAFQNEYTKAKQALAQQDDTSASTALLAMSNLYRGDYVQPFYSDWCTFRRDELRTSYLNARQLLAQLTWRSEQFEESMHHWQHMLAVDTCQEEAHYGLMRCYLRQGKRGLALRQYQRCRDTLQQELGVQPGPTIQHLYQRLVAPPAH